jgi:serine protease Do
MRSLKIILLMVMSFMCLSLTARLTDVNLSNVISQNKETVVSVYTLIDDEDYSLTQDGIITQDNISNFKNILGYSTDGEDTSVSGGSGFIYSSDGYIITNAHVIHNAAKVKVKLYNRKEYIAEIIGVDLATDLALLKIDADNLPYVKVGDSVGSKQGDLVWAIGSPYGLENTLTQGVISSLNRTLPGYNYVNFIQTDVQINPGNSGGPLFNHEGEMVGVNSQILTFGGNPSGLSFAVPSHIVRQFFEKVSAEGEFKRGWLGITFQDVSSNLADYFKLENPQGALISSIHIDSPAYDSKLKAGDVILEVNGTKIEDAVSLAPVIGLLSPGENLKLLVNRAGDTFATHVSLIDMPSSLLAHDDDLHNGVKSQIPVSKYENDLRVEQRGDHVVVKAIGVSHFGVDENAVKVGDIVTEVNGVAINNVKDFDRLASSQSGSGTNVLLLKCKRGVGLHSSFYSAVKFKPL